MEDPVIAVFLSLAASALVVHGALTATGKREDVAWSTILIHTTQVELWRHTERYIKTEYALAWRASLVVGWMLASTFTVIILVRHFGALW